MHGYASRTEALLKENAINLRHYWNLLMINRWWIASLVVVASVVAAALASRLDPVYRATTTVLLESKQANIVSIQDIYGLNTHNKEYFLTQFEILKSRELAERVITRLSLSTHPEFDPRQQREFDWRAYVPEAMSVVKAWFPADAEPLTEQAVSAAVLARFTNGLSISPVTNTQLVKIHFEAGDPKLAAEIANEMADVYIESFLEARLDMTQKAASWLTDRLDGLKAKLKESETRLQEYREQEELVYASGVKTLNSSELNDLTLRHVEASKRRAEAASLMEQVQRYSSTSNFAALLQLPVIVEHELVRSLKTSEARAEQKIAELAERYGPKHPMMVSARAEVNKIGEELRHQVMRVASGITSDYQIALETERAVSRQLQQAKAKMQDVNRKEFRLSELEREVETNRQLYDMFLMRAKETHEASGLQAAHARVIDAAQVSGTPVAPKVKLIVLLAAVAALGFSVILAFVRDALDNTVKTPDDVEEKLGANMLGFLPMTKGGSKILPFEGFLSDNSGRFAESVRSLRTGVVLSNLDQPHKIIVVTSTLPGEGKSTVALNLAEALGQMERVLLIDADLRRPALGRVLKVEQNAPGLSNLVSGVDRPETCIRNFKSSRIDILTAGATPLKPQELLSSKRFRTVLDSLRQQYDRIIIDSPPTQPVSDALVLATHADAVVYVVKASETPAALITKGMKRLREVNALLVGVVLNQVEIKKLSRYSDYYAGYGTYAPS